jgi:hypothetical protein
MSPAPTKMCPKCRRAFHPEPLHPNDLCWWCAHGIPPQPEPKKKEKP